MNLNLNANGLGKLVTTRGAIAPVGTVLSETAWASLTNYTNVGTGISVSGGQLNMTGGNATFTDYLLWNDTLSPWLNTCLEKWTISVKAIAPTISATSYGFGLGVRCTNSFTQMNAIFRWAWDTGATNGIYMYPNNSLASQLVGGARTNPTGGQTVYFDVVRNKNVYTATAYQSDHSTVLISQVFTMNLSTGAVNQANNTGKWVLENFGGTNLKILEWTISTPAQKNCDIVFLGDSNEYGMFAVSNANRFAENAAVTRGKTFEILAGIGDRTSDLITRLLEVKALNPSYVILSIGRNDIANGIGTGTWQANINTIISTIAGYGIPVKLAGVIASNVDVSAVQTFYSGKTNQQVNSYVATKSGTTTLNATYDSGDGIHMNVAGNTALSTLYQTII